MLLASLSESLTSALTSAIGDHGLYAVFALMAIDAVLPAASELVMVYAGAVAAGAFAGHNVTLLGTGTIESEPAAYVAMALAGSIGYLVGSIGGWAIGLYGGRPFVERHGRWLHLPPSRVDRAERWFERFGDWAVFIGRVTPVARSFISIPAGLFRMPLGRYTLLTAIGSTLWCFAFAGAGYALGHSWERFHHGFRYVDIAVGVALVAAAAFLVVRTLRRRRAAGGEARGGSEPAEE